MDKEVNEKKQNIIFETNTIFPAAVSCSKIKENELIHVSFAGRLVAHKNSVDVHVSSSVIMPLEMVKNLKKEIDDIIKEIEKKK